MPNLSSVSASLALSSSRIQLRELGISYDNSAVTACVPCPFQPPGRRHVVPFFIRVKGALESSTAKWCHGDGVMLAVILYVNGKYAGIEFLTESMKHVKFSGWAFQESRVVTIDNHSRPVKDEGVDDTRQGTIEILVLRCHVPKPWHTKPPFPPPSSNATPMLPLLPMFTVTRRARPSIRRGTVSFTKKARNNAQSDSDSSVSSVEMSRGGSRKRKESLGSQESQGYQPIIFDTPYMYTPQGDIVIPRRGGPSLALPIGPLTGNENGNTKPRKKEKVAKRKNAAKMKNPSSYSVDDSDSSSSSSSDESSESGKTSSDASPQKEAKKKKSSKKQKPSESQTANTIWSSPDASATGESESDDSSETEPGSKAEKKKRKEGKKKGKPKKGKGKRKSKEEENSDKSENDKKDDSWGKEAASKQDTKKKSKAKFSKKKGKGKGKENEVKKSGGRDDERGQENQEWPPNNAGSSDDTNTGDKDNEWAKEAEGWGNEDNEWATNNVSSSNNDNPTWDSGTNNNNDGNCKGWGPSDAQGSGQNNTTSNNDATVNPYAEKVFAKVKKASNSNTGSANDINVKDGHNQKRHTSPQPSSSYQHTEQPALDWTARNVRSIYKNPLFQQYWISTLPSARIITSPHDPSLHRHHVPAKRFECPDGRCLIPEYLDDLKRPLAVFRFWCRNKEQLKKDFKLDAHDDEKEMEAFYRSLSKDELVGLLMKRN